MLEGYSPVTQALLGTLFTWGLTAAGAALVFVFSSRQVIKGGPIACRACANILNIVLIKYLASWQIYFATDDLEQKSLLPRKYINVAADSGSVA